MNKRLATAALATLGGISALFVPAVGHAANVGYHGACFNGSKVPAITAAGHTAVAVATLNAASLASLGGLIIENCNGASLAGKINADVLAATSAGMQLIINDWNPGAATAAALPGNPAMAWQQVGGSQLDLVSGMPFITGAGGTLTNTSLDGGNSSNHGYTTSAAPGGVTRLLTTADPSQTVGIAYAYGAGQVVYNAIPMDAYLPGGILASNPVSAGMNTYLTNMLAPGPGTTCASEGYTGTKLEWCKNICERGLTGATLDAWIHRWILRYRALPYCAI